MRALILSDIHSNIDALEAVLEAAPKFDVVWNLGDIVGYGGTPNEVVERARDLGDIFVRGNHDRACAGLIHAQEFNPVALYAVHWTQQELTRDNMDWMRTVPRGPILPADSQVTCVHGAPRDEDQYLLSMGDAWQQKEHLSNPLTLFGHTHVQGGFSLSTEGGGGYHTPIYSSHDKVDFYELNLRREGTKYLINPGSVGQPRDRDWRAAFALYDDEAHRITFGRVPYPVHVAQIRIQRAGLPESLATRLRSGR
jgi:predicted phosphodiesterase